MLDKPEAQVTPLLWADDIQLPDASSDYVIKNLINRGDYAIAFGASRSYKSFWLADLAFHVVLGKPYYGIPVRQGGVVILALEGQRGFLNRILAQRVHRASELRGRLPLAVWTLPVRFCKDTKDVESVVASIKAHFREMPLLIGIDTQSRAMGGGEENGSEDMGQYIDACGLLTAATGAAVVSIHHPGKNNERGPRGHYSNYAGGDLVIEMTRAADSSVSLARVIKQKDGPEDWQLSFKLQPIELGRDADGDPIVSCVVVPTDAPPPTEKKKKAVRLSPAKKIALQALERAIEEVGAKPPSNPNIGAPLVVTFDQWRLFAYQMGISKGKSDSAKRMAFDRASEDLVGAKLALAWGEYCWCP